jgi:hypothetical protein
MALAGKVEVSIGLPRRELTMLETALRRELAVTLMYGNGVSNMTVDQMRELIERTISVTREVATTVATANMKGSEND